ncbi:peptidase M1 alanine aminopeptidase A4 hydrolase [Coleophoma cylindrospora]|uniref:Aminopeptidase n=1 Tax=Coleophoma cylindrospora TaxID=1849047 RepID=A0A3D8QJZ8_9HELO|nr:peptidase M1 alanine aminopeptidase A4 hydrolase [Coleophoma cylindrospora]
MDRDTLPTTFKPSNYDLAIDGITFSPTWTYEGHVTISGSVEAAKEIVINAHQLKIYEAQLKTEGTMKAANVQYQEEQQRAKLVFDEDFPSSQNAELIIRFQGLINDEMAGFSRSKYTPAAPPAPSVAHHADAEHHYMFSTQFQPCDARRAFPCFDEPAMKASFELSIEIPDDQIALCNTPEKETTASSRPAGSKDYKWKVIKFEKSPVMSTYLYTWAFGNFGYVEAETERRYNGKRLPVRVYTTKGLEEQGRYALEHAWKFIDLLSEIFQIDYPLPKCDLLAVHDFATGAMEGTTAVLFDEKNSDLRFRKRIANVVGHELAHQWFGNLVTMNCSIGHVHIITSKQRLIRIVCERWNELWLNEGFATWVGCYVTDRLHPEWSVWAQFVAESMSEAFNLDSIRNSHPIEVPVRNAPEIAQIFDAISYLKGSSVIRMLSAHLSDKVFLQGVTNYLKKHAYGNAKTDDLWLALSEASGLDINKMMDHWINRIGLPVVTVAEEPGQITLRQSRFLLSGDVKSEEDQTIWTIPLALETSPQASKTSILIVKEDTIYNVDDSFYKINKDNIGFYRTNYPPERLSKLGSPKSRARLSTEDKIGLVSDAAALANSGYSTTPALLALIEGFGEEDNYLAWNSVMTVLSRVRSVFSDDRTSDGLTTFTLKLITPAVERIGWKFNPEEDLLQGQLRALLIESAGLAGHQPTIKEALSRFERYTGGDMSAIHPSLRSAVFRIAVKTQGKPAFDALQKEFLTSKTFDGALCALAAMGYIPTTDLAHEYLQFAFDGKVKSQDVHQVAASLAANFTVNIEVWNYIKEHYDNLYELLSCNMGVFDRFLRMGLAKYSSKKVHDDIKDFFADKDCKGFDRGIGVVLDQIANASAYKERDSKALEEWLEAHSYL